MIAGNGMGHSTVTSPFVTRGTGFGVTHIWITGSRITAQGGVVLDLTGSTGYYAIRDSYIVMTGNGVNNGHVIEMDSQSTEGGCIVGDNWRTENQTGPQSGGSAIATGVTAFYFNDANTHFGCNLHADLEVADGGASEGPSIGGTATIVNSTMEFTSGSSDFGGTVNIGSSHVYATGANFGAVNHAFGTWFYLNQNSQKPASVFSSITQYLDAHVCNYESWDDALAPNPSGLSYVSCAADSVDTIGGVRQYPANENPGTGVLSMPGTNAASYFYNTGSGARDGVLVYGANSASSTPTLLDVYVGNNTGYGPWQIPIRVNLHDGMPTGSYVWMPDGTQLNASDKICYYNGSTYTNCPTSGIGNVPLTIPATSVTAGACTSPTTFAWTGLPASQTTPPLALFATNNGIQTSPAGFGAGGGVNIQVGLSGTAGQGEYVLCSTVTETTGAFNVVMRAQ